MRPRTDTQTDTQTRVTKLHFSWSSTHAKCKNIKLPVTFLRLIIANISQPAEGHNIAPVKDVKS